MRSILSHDELQDEHYADKLNPPMLSPKAERRLQVIDDLIAKNADQGVIDALVDLHEFLTDLENRP